METANPRRRIVKQFILGTAASWLGGAWLSETVLATDTPVIQSTGTLIVQLSQFPALTAAGGSVRLNVGLDYPVAINRGAGNAMFAVSTRCAHLGCTVNGYDAGLAAMRCGCHGSLYTIDGSLAGGPATRGLDRYTAFFDGMDTVTVRLPDVTFGARNIAIQSTTSSSKRLKLTFHPAVFTSYQVQYRVNLSDAPQVIGFSTTPQGAATQTTYRNTVFNPNDPTPATNLSVDATGSRGFFSIALIVSEY